MAAVLRNRFFMWIFFVLNACSLSAQLFYGPYQGDCQESAPVCEESKTPCNTTVCQECPAPQAVCFVQAPAPCPKRRYISPKALYLFAGAALGAGFGAFTGYFAGHDKGPRGEDFQFPRDTGQTLNFTFSGSYLASFKMGAVLDEFSFPTFFVTLPDQTTIEAPYLLNNFDITPLAIDDVTIFINDPLFGLYSAGVRLSVSPQVFFTSSEPAPDTITITDFSIVATASRNDSITSLLNNETSTLIANSKNDQLQMSANFTYDNGTIP